MQRYALAHALNAVRETTPLVHCITNYVTVNDVANALLAVGGSPIMSDEAADVADITSICDALVINIGTLNERTIEAMEVAGRRAGELGHPIVLDPVGAGASALRTDTAATLCDELPISVIRGNMSEIKALVGAAKTTRGVDANPADAVTRENLGECAAFATELAQTSEALVVVTGAIDLIADSDHALAVFNGHPTMATITGSGCMLTAVTAAYRAAVPENPLEAVSAAVALFGLAGQRAADRMAPVDGVGSFRTYLLDALTTLTADELEAGARIEAIR